MQARWLVVAAIMGVAFLLDLLGVETHATATWDRESELAVHHIWGPTVYPFFRAVSNSGAGLTRGFVVVAILLVLYLTHRQRLGWLFLIAILGTAGLEYLVNAAIARPRPQLFPHGVAVSGYSFPSGHTTNSAALSLILIYIAWQLAAPRLATLTATVLLIAYAGLVGLSRIVLGVHYPTDVLGGYAFAGACVALSIALCAPLLQSRRDRSDTLEETTQET